MEKHCSKSYPNHAGTRLSIYRLCFEGIDCGASPARWSATNHWFSSEEKSHSCSGRVGKFCEDERVQPITYNHYFTDNIQKDRLQDLREQIGNAIDANNGTQLYEELKYDLERVMESHLTEVDMRKQACKEAKSALNAYYKVYSHRCCCLMIELSNTHVLL